MSLWIPVTLAAAFFQTLRFMLQRQLALNTLSATGATFARFLYSAPLVAVLCTIYLTVTQQAFPTTSWTFWGFGALGGLTQILATVCVVMLFKQRNFAVGITFKKTEVIQTVLVGLFLLGEGASVYGFLAILLGLFGVLLLSAPPDTRWSWSTLWNRSAALGLASGLMFAFSGVSYRGASLELGYDDPVARAAVTLAAVTMMQMCAMAVWLRLRETGQISAVWAARRLAVWVGLMSMAGSFCWFTAFTLQNAAYVNAVGQVELILSMMATVLIFREKVSPRECAGMFVLLGSIVSLIIVI